MPKPAYVAIIEELFLSRYRKGKRTVDFLRSDIGAAAVKLGLAHPKNLGDLIYTFRFRQSLPESICSTAPADESWIIRLAGPARYRFARVPKTLANIIPRTDRVCTKVPEATPGIIAKYALNDEQALLAKLRYNRLIDIFTGTTCYSLQSHLRTQVKDLGQTETDELYVGLDRRGVHFVFPVQAKGGKDRHGIVQIEQDVAMCAAKFPHLVCRPIAAQFMKGNVIALLEFEMSKDQIGVVREEHYLLVPPKDLTDKELADYRHRSLA